MELPIDKVKKLQIALKEAIEIDNYGQRSEAYESYKHVQNLIHRYLNQECCVFNQRQCHLLIKIIASINQRIDTIKNPKIVNPVDIKAIKDLHANLENILFNTNFNFPIRISADDFDQAIPRYLEFPHPNRSKTIDNDNNNDFIQTKELAKRNGNLLPYPTFNIPNRTCLTLIIDKLDIKSAGSYIDPFLQISVKDKKGITCSQIQTTPITLDKTDDTIIFNCEVHIQQSVESISSDDAIYLEFYHFKPKKGTNSLKCFSIIERDEIREGLLHLEIYKKPIDYKRKKLKLLDTNARLMHVVLYLTLN